MVIGSKFNKKYQNFLKEIGKLSKGDIGYKVPVQDINKKLVLDRIEIKNVLDFLKELGYIEIATIGGPFLYGHVTITEAGLEKCSEISNN